MSRNLNGHEYGHCQFVPRWCQSLVGQVEAYMEVSIRVLRSSNKTHAHTRLSASSGVFPSVLSLFTHFPRQSENCFPFPMEEMLVDQHYHVPRHQGNGSPTWQSVARLALGGDGPRGTSVGSRCASGFIFQCSLMNRYFSVRLTQYIALSDRIPWLSDLLNVWLVLCWCVNGPLRSDFYHLITL